MSTAQLVTYGDASFANMDGSKSQCGVIAFLTPLPRRFWHGEFQLTLQALQLRITQWQKLFRRHSGPGRCSLKMWLSVPCSLPRSLRTAEEDSSRREILTLSDSFNLCQAVNPDKSIGSDKRLRIVTAMVRHVYCGTQGATLALSPQLRCSQTL